MQNFKQQLDDLKALILGLDVKNTSVNNVIRDDAGKEFWSENFRGLFAVPSDAFIEAVRTRFKNLSHEILLSLRRSIDADGNGTITQGEFNAFCAKKGFADFILNQTTLKVLQLV